MKTLFLLLLLVAGVSFTLYARAGGAPAPEPERPALPLQPTEAEIELVFVQPFALDRPGVHSLRAERPAYDRGQLVVLRADPERWLPRQGYESVLYAGAETARRVNVGHGSGHVVAIVPGDVDLSVEPIFFGAPELPERITAEEARRQRDGARAAGLPGALAAAAAVEHAEPLHAEDEHGLFWHASTLVERYAPDERDLVDSLRAPLLTR